MSLILTESLTLLPWVPTKQSLVNYSSHDFESLGKLKLINMLTISISSLFLGHVKHFGVI